MLPFTCQEELTFGVGSFLWVPGIRSALLAGESDILAYVVTEEALNPIRLSLDQLTQKERTIIAEGCLINYYKQGN